MEAIEKVKTQEEVDAYVAKGAAAVDAATEIYTAAILKSMKPGEDGALSPEQAHFLNYTRHAADAAKAGLLRPELEQPEAPAEEAEKPKADDLNRGGKARVKKG